MFGGFILIEVCDANPASCPELFDLEEVYSGVSVLENSCMSECELCAHRPYLLLNGDVISAQTVEELLAQTHSALNQLVIDEADTSI